MTVRDEEQLEFAVRRAILLNRDAFGIPQADPNIKVDIFPLKSHGITQKEPGGYQVICKMPGVDDDTNKGPFIELVGAHEAAHILVMESRLPICSHLWQKLRGARTSFAEEALCEGLALQSASDSYSIDQLLGNHYPASYREIAEVYKQHPGFALETISKREVTQH